MGRNDNDISKAYDEGYELTKSQLENGKLTTTNLLGKPQFDILLMIKVLTILTGSMTKISR